MRRRSFLSLAGAAAFAPAIPALPAPAAAAAGYNRYQYGLAVFHARTRASLTATDLMGRLKVGAGTAQAMIGEMTARGVVGPGSGAAGAVRALDAIPSRRMPSLGRIAKRTLGAFENSGGTGPDSTDIAPPPAAPAEDPDISDMPESSDDTRP